MLDAKSDPGRVQSPGRGRRLSQPLDTGSSCSPRPRTGRPANACGSGPVESVSRGGLSQFRRGLRAGQALAESNTSPSWPRTWHGSAVAESWSCAARRTSPEPGDRRQGRPSSRASAGGHVFPAWADGPRLSVGLSKACVQRRSLLVTTDSGPRHFAHAFDRPVVTLFGPTHIGWTETYHARAVHLQKTGALRALPATRLPSGSSVHDRAASCPGLSGSGGAPGCHAPTHHT